MMLDLITTSLLTVGTNVGSGVGDVGAPVVGAGVGAAVGAITVGACQCKMIYQGAHPRGASGKSSAIIQARAYRDMKGSKVPALPAGISSGPQQL